MRTKIAVSMLALSLLFVLAVNAEMSANYSTTVVLEGKVVSVQEDMLNPVDSVHRDEFVTITPVILTMRSEKGSDAVVTVFCVGKENRCKKLNPGEKITMLGHLASHYLTVARIWQESKLWPVAVIVDRVAVRRP